MATAVERLFRGISVKPVSLAFEATDDEYSTLPLGKMACGDSMPSCHPGSTE